MRYATYPVLLLFSVGCFALPDCPKDRTKRYHNCYGTYIFADGGKYVGEFKNNIFHGQGTITFADGSKYVGEHKDGKIHGQGTMTSADGSKYVGEHKDGFPHGQGTMTWGSGSNKGSKYVGEWKANKIHGQGTLTFAYGDTYAGSFIDYPTKPDEFEKWVRSNLTLQTDISTRQNINRDNYAEYVRSRFQRNIEFDISKLSLNENPRVTYRVIRENWEFKKIELVRSSKNLEWNSAVELALRKSLPLPYPRGKGIPKTLIISFTPRGNVTTNTGENTQRVDNTPNANPVSTLNTDEGSKEELAQRERPLSITVEQSVPDGDGLINFRLKSSNAIASLKIDGREEIRGRKQVKLFNFARIPLPGDSSYTIDVLDVYGNKERKIVRVSRDITQDQIAKVEPLNPLNSKKSRRKNAVALIIGVSKYKNLPDAKYADKDARRFYDYANRSLGIPKESIVLLVNEDAERLNIFEKIDTKFSSKVKKNKTEVYVFYAGHGLPSRDGKSLYLTPFDTNRRYLNESGIKQDVFFEKLASLSPSHVTLFIDSCYSGITRSGEAIFADARPLLIVKDNQSLPSNFTLFGASKPDEISYSSDQLGHGLFSYYLMKGLEGVADINADGKILSSELHQFIYNSVISDPTKKAIQSPIFKGDQNKFLAESKR